MSAKAVKVCSEIAEQLDAWALALRACQTLVQSEMTTQRFSGCTVKWCSYCVSSQHEPHCPVGMAVKALDALRGAE